MIINMILGYSLGYEIFKIKKGEKVLGIFLFYKLSAWFQDKLFTREPSDKQLEVAILAFETLLEEDNRIDK